MISVLIPIYNQSIINLALTLNSQCKGANINYEILCFDDCSEEAFKLENRKLDHEFGISYLELSENLGRSKIRNLLAKQSRYEYLLFLDGDSEIDNSNFIQNYLQHIANTTVIYGGRMYQAMPPSDGTKYLHWLYGSKREALSLIKRKQNPYRAFQTNNFLIKKEIVLLYPFEERLNSYGYEDLVFAEKLKDDGIPISHIENPIIHAGLETHNDFLIKSKEAAENLAILYHEGNISDTRMIQFYQRLKKIGFNSLVHKLIQRKTDYFLQNLKSTKPNLLFFDLYRFYHFNHKLIELKASSF